MQLHAARMPTGFNAETSRHASQSECRIIAFAKCNLVAQRCDYNLEFPFIWPRPFTTTALLNCNIVLTVGIKPHDNFLLWGLIRARTQGRRGRTVNVAFA